MNRARQYTMWFLHLTLLGVFTLTVAAWILMPGRLAISWSTEDFVVIVTDAVYISVDPLMLRSEDVLPAGLDIPTDVTSTRSIFSALRVGKWRRLPFKLIFTVELTLLFLLFMQPCIDFVLRLHRTDLARAGRCPSCEYDLTGNTSGTCPECGELLQRPTDAESRA